MLIGFGFSDEPDPPIVSATIFVYVQFTLDIIESISLRKYLYFEDKI